MPATSLHEAALIERILDRACARDGSAGDEGSESPGEEDIWSGEDEGSIDSIESDDSSASSTNGDDASYSAAGAVPLAHKPRGGKRARRAALAAVARAPNGVGSSGGIGGGGGGVGSGSDALLLTTETGRDADMLPRELRRSYLRRNRRPDRKLRNRAARRLRKQAAKAAAASAGAEKAAPKVAAKPHAWTVAAKRARKSRRLLAEEGGTGGPMTGALLDGEADFVVGSEVDAAVPTAAHRAKRPTVVSSRSSRSAPTGTVAAARVSEDGEALAAGDDEGGAIAAAGDALLGDRDLQQLEADAAATATRRSEELAGVGRIAAARGVESEEHVAEVSSGNSEEGGADEPSEIDESSGAEVDTDAADAPGASTAEVIAPAAADNSGDEEIAAATEGGAPSITWPPLESPAAASRASPPTPPRLLPSPHAPAAGVRPPTPPAHRTLATATMPATVRALAARALPNRRARSPSSALQHAFIGVAPEEGARLPKQARVGVQTGRNGAPKDGSVKANVAGGTAHARALLADMLREIPRSPRAARQWRMSVSCFHLPSPCAAARSRQCGLIEQ